MYLGFFYSGEFALLLSSSRSLTVNDCAWRIRKAPIDLGIHEVADPVIWVGHPGLELLELELETSRIALEDLGLVLAWKH